MAEPQPVPEAGAIPRRSLWLAVLSVPTAAAGFLWVAAMSPLVNAAGDSRAALISVVRAGYFILETIAFGLGAYGVRIGLRPGHGKCALFGFLGVFLSLSGLMPAMTSCRAHARTKAVRSVVENAVRAGEHAKALEVLNRVISENPGVAPLYALRGDVLGLTGECAEARADFEMALSLAPEQAGVLAALAGLLATCPEGDVRDGEAAVRHGTKACELTQWREPRCLAALAAACAEAGRFDEAVEHQEAALSLGLPPAEREKAQSRLEGYRAGEPARHTHPAPEPVDSGGGEGAEEAPADPPEGDTP